MDENDDLKDIPPMVPDRDDVDSHISNKRSQNQEIVRPSYYTQKVKVSTWPVRILLSSAWKASMLLDMRLRASFLMSSIILLPHFGSPGCPPIRLWPDPVLRAAG